MNSDVLRKYNDKDYDFVYEVKKLYLVITKVL